STGTSLADEAFTCVWGATNNFTITCPCTAYSIRVEPDTSSDTTTAANAILGEITADVVGIRDDVYGTLSAVPQAVLENPADVVAYILSLYPFDVDRADDWADTRARLEALGLRWAFMLGSDGNPRFSALRKLIGDQSRSRLSVEAGEYVLRDIPAA